MEIWKDIPGYEGRYQASTEGRIRSVSRIIQEKNISTGKIYYHNISGRILKPGRYCKSGHLSVVLGHGADGSPVHQLVMRTFIGEPPVGMEVLHKNGNPTDNQLCNLHYGTRTENILDVYRQGGKWRKLSVDDVEAIRFGLWCGIKGAELSRMFDVAPISISRIKNERTFAWLE
jgi:hypothetical protein